MNIIQIAGHLGVDVETRYTPDGTKVSSLRVATNLRKGGQDETIWWQVSLWGDRWDKLLPHLKKGSSIIIVGEMQKPRIYNNRDGQPQVALDIRAEFIRFSPFGRGDRDQQSGSYGGQSQGGYSQQGGGQSQQGSGQGQQQDSSFASTTGQASDVGEFPEDEDLPF